MDEALPVGTRTTMTLRKFDGEVPPDCPDPVAAGYTLLEEIEITYDENGEKVSETRRVF
jgi:hypothetical protein